MNSSVTRRTFLKGSAATAALAATGAGVCSLGAWQAEVAHAEGSYERKEGASLCNGCSSKCGLVATTLGSCSRCAAATCIPTPRAPSAVEATAWRRSPIPTSA